MGGTDQQLGAAGSNWSARTKVIILLFYMSQSAPKYISRTWMAWLNGKSKMEWELHFTENYCEIPTFDSVIRMACPLQLRATTI